jgi:hypothetical protein
MKFVLKFRGMCSFVIPSGGNEAWVLMKDLVSPSKGLQGHRAVIKVGAQYVRALNVPPESTIFLLLDRAIVDILPGGKSLKGVLKIKDFARTGNPDLTNPTNVCKDSFLWVAPLARACQGAGINENGGYADEKLVTGSLPEHMAARVHLKGGRLRVTSRSVTDKKYIVWRFRPASGIFRKKGYRQILASEVSFEIGKLAEEFVDIQIQEPGAKRTLRLVPQGRKIEVEIINEEAEQLVEVGDPEIIRLRHIRAQDRIFETYYGMSKLSTLRHGPIPVAAKLVGKASDDDHAHNAPPCSPSQMVLGS